MLVYKYFKLDYNLVELFAFLVPGMPLSKLSSHQLGYRSTSSSSLRQRRVTNRDLAGEVDNTNTRTIISRFVN